MLPYIISCLYCSGSIPQLSNDINPTFYHNIVKPILVRTVCYYNDIVMYV